MSWLTSFLNPEKPYKDAQKEMDKYYQESKGFQQPLVDQGQAAYGNLNSVMQSLLNPQQLENEWSQGFNLSPEAKQMQDMATNEGLNAASSMGLMGSSPALQAIQGGRAQIGLNERNNYLDRLMQKYLAGAGIAGNIYNTGAGARTNLSNNALNTGNNMAQLKFGESAAPGSLFGNLIGTGASLAAGALSGPMGYGLGSKLFGNENMPQYSLYGHGPTSANYEPPAGRNLPVPFR